MYLKFGPFTLIHLHTLAKLEGVAGLHPSQGVTLQYDSILEYSECTLSNLIMTYEISYLIMTKHFTLVFCTSKLYHITFFPYIHGSVQEIWGYYDILD